MSNKNENKNKGLFTDVINGISRSHVLPSFLLVDGRLFELFLHAGALQGVETYELYSHGQELRQRVGQKFLFHNHYEKTKNLQNSSLKIRNYFRTSGHLICT